MSREIENFEDFGKTISLDFIDQTSYQIEIVVSYMEGHIKWKKKNVKSSKNTNKPFLEFSHISKFLF